MTAYTRDEMVSVTDLLKGFKNALHKLSSHEVEKIAIMKNNKPEAVIVAIEEYEMLREYKYWNTLSEKEYLKKSHESLATSTRAYSLDELDTRIEKTISQYEN